MVPKEACKPEATQGKAARAGRALPSVKTIASLYYVYINTVVLEW